MAQAVFSEGALRGAQQARADGGLKLVGLFELDAEDKVLYSRYEPDGGAAAAPDFTGQNFYAGAAPFLNVGEFRREIEAFRRGTQASQSFNFTCEYEGGPLNVRVLLTRIRERSEQDVTKSVLVHIRRAQK